MHILKQTCMFCNRYTYSVVNLSSGTVSSSYTRACSVTWISSKDEPDELQGRGIYSSSLYFPISSPSDSEYDVERNMLRICSVDRPRLWDMLTEWNYPVHCPPSQARSLFSFMIPFTVLFHDTVHCLPSGFRSMLSVMILFTVLLHDPVHCPPSWYRSLSSFRLPFNAFRHDPVHCSPSWSRSLSSFTIPFTGLLQVSVHCPPSWARSLASVVIPFTVLFQTTLACEDSLKLTKNLYNTKI